MSNIIKTILEKEKKKIENRLAKIIHQADVPALQRAGRCYFGEITSMKLWVSTKDENYMKRATAWNASKKKYIKLGKLQSKHKWWIDERVSLENDLREINSKLYRI